MSIAEMLKRVAEAPGVKVQFLNECLVGASERKKPYRHTELRIATTNITPTEIAIGDPRMVCALVWVPMAEYEKATKE